MHRDSQGDMCHGHLRGHVCRHVCGHVHSREYAHAYTHVYPHVHTHVCAQSIDMYIPGRQGRVGATKPRFSSSDDTQQPGGLCLDNCLDMCLDICFDMCIGRLDMCLGMCLDTCLDLARPTTPSSPEACV